MADAYRDENFVPTLIAASNVDGQTPVRVYADPTTHRLLVDMAGGGTGTVTSVSVVTANGFAGSVATATTTPAITLSTTITGILKGNGTAISAGTAGDVDSILPTQTGNNGKFLTTDGTNSSWGTPASGGGITIGTTTITSGTTTRILYDNAGVVGEYTITGSGTVVAMQTSPTFVTDITTPVAKLSASLNQLVLNSGGVTGTITWTPTSTNKTVTIPDRTLTIDNITTSTTTNGTGFLKGNGSVISFDSSTYLTGLTVGTTTISSGTTTRILYDNAGTLGEYTLTGSGTVVAMATAPTFVTSITTPSVLATANDSGALGASGTAFSDLFLASGAVINFNAGNYTITHSAGLLTTNGNLSLTTSGVLTTGTIELGNASDTTLSRSAAGILAVEGVDQVNLSSSQTLTNKTLTSPTIQTAPVYASGTNVILTVPTVDDTATGEITNAFNSGYTSSAIGDLVYLDSSSTWQKADADLSATAYSGMLGIALEVKASGNALKVLLRGFAYCSTAFPTFTVGGIVYMSATAGAVTQTAPTTTDSATRILGYAVHADKMWFNPSQDYVVHT